MSQAFYFERFEDRRPPPPVPQSTARDLLYQTLAVAAAGLGVSYLWWRWTASLNHHALWFAVPLVIAETLAFIGSVLFFLSIWRTGDVPFKDPPKTVDDILREKTGSDRPLIVDVFFPTYTEDPELVRLSIKDAKKLTYPHPIELRIHVLDDGKRAAMKAVADQEGVGYLTRTNNAGYKAGNLRNAMENTQGDLIVICDADTRPFPQLLERTLGYFRDPQVAWVQTPQWFFDIPKGDPLGNDAELFYDVIQRRRNWCNASFCCGAGSIHRREAVMEAALKAYGLAVEASVDAAGASLPQPIEMLPASEQAALSGMMATETARETELTPYKFHVSEDIYTSIVLHSQKWKSVFHPEILSKMLSPQDLLAWTVQRFKYAGGTIDIAKNDNPLAMPGLSDWQKVCYASTIWSYLAPLWTVPFLLAPIIYFFTGIAPVATYDAAFYAHALPFLLINRLAFMVATWGVDATRGEQYYLAFFWVNLKALADVLQGKPVKFKVTPKTKEARRFVELAWPHLALIGLTLAGASVGALRLAHGGGHPSAYAVNLFWSLNNVYSLSPLVLAAISKQEDA